MRAAARLILHSSESFIALLCGLSSVSYLAGAPQPRTIDALLPFWLRFTWGAYLLFGGVLTLLGLVVGIRRVEKAGLLLLSGPAVVYGVAIVAAAGWRAVFPAGITFAFAAAFSVRASNRLQALATRWLT